MPFHGSPTEYYVTPSGNDTTGDGSSGTPWATLDKALATITHDTTNGVRINVNGTTSISATLSTAYTGTTTDAPLLIQGYTSTPGDGGLAILDCGGMANPAWSHSLNYVCFADLHFRNIGNSYFIANTGVANMIFRCVFSDGDSGGVRTTSTSYQTVMNCYFYDLGDSGVGLRMNSTIGCFFDCTQTKQFGTYAALMSDGAGYTFLRNIVKMGGSTVRGVLANSQMCNIIGNVFYVDTPAASQIGVLGNTSAALYGNLTDNIFVGFSGASSFAWSGNFMCEANNIYYDNTNNRTTARSRVLDVNNTVAAALPMLDPENDDYRPADIIRRLSLFTGNPNGLSIPNYMNPGVYQDRLTLGLPRM